MDHLNRHFTSPPPTPSGRPPPPTGGGEFFSKALFHGALEPCVIPDAPAAHHPELPGITSLDLSVDDPLVARDQILFSHPGYFSGNLSHRAFDNEVMTAPRQILPETTYMVTRRCSERRFFLRPSVTVNQIFTYCLAYAAQETGVLLHA